MTDTTTTQPTAVELVEALKACDRVAVQLLADLEAARREPGFDDELNQRFCRRLRENADLQARLRATFEDLVR